MCVSCSKEKQFSTEVFNDTKGDTVRTAQSSGVQEAEDKDKLKAEEDAKKLLLIKEEIAAAKKAADEAEAKRIADEAEAKK